MQHGFTVERLGGIRTGHYPAPSLRGVLFRMNWGSDRAVLLAAPRASVFGVCDERRPALRPMGHGQILKDAGRQLVPHTARQCLPWVKIEHPTVGTIATVQGKTRAGMPCRTEAMKNGRCRMHRGMSTGPRTPEGIERIRAARTKHRRYSAASIARRRAGRQAIREIRALLRSAAATEDECWLRWKGDDEGPPQDTERSRQSAQHYPSCCRFPSASYLPQSEAIAPAPPVPQAGRRFLAIPSAGARKRMGAGRTAWRAGLSSREDRKE